MDPTSLEVYKKTILHYVSVSCLHALDHHLLHDNSNHLSLNWRDEKAVNAVSEIRYSLKLKLEKSAALDLETALQLFNESSGCSKPFPPGMFAKLRSCYF